MCRYLKPKPKTVFHTFRFSSFRCSRRGAARGMVHGGRGRLPTTPASRESRYLRPRWDVHFSVADWKWLHKQFVRFSSRKRFCWLHAMMLNSCQATTAAATQLAECFCPCCCLYNCSFTFLTKVCRRPLEEQMFCVSLSNRRLR